MVNHKILLEDIRLSTLPNNLIRWMSSYLHGRSAITEFRNTYSKQRLIKTGVPQGSIISPVLFNFAHQKHRFQILTSKCTHTQTTLQFNQQSRILTTYGKYQHLPTKINHIFRKQGSTSFQRKIYSYINHTANGTIQCPSSNKSQ